MNRRNTTSSRRPPLDPEDSHEYFARMSYLVRISIDPAVRSGKPCIRGLRITVYGIPQYLASGMSQEEILAAFPDLTADSRRHPRRSRFCG